jgi:hypothetical protein
MDRYAAAVIGIDSFITRWCKRHGFVSPIADLLADERVINLLEPLREHYPDDQVNRLINKLRDKNPSMKDRFARVADGLKLDEKARANFSDIVDDRAPVMHGSTGVIAEGASKKAIEVLTTLLKAVYLAAPA